MNRCEKDRKLSSETIKVIEKGKEQAEKGIGRTWTSSKVRLSFIFFIIGYSIMISFS